jgi:hypothetical protein
VTGGGGFGFDLWTPEEGSSASFSYGRIEDAHYARKFEIRSRTKSFAEAIVACDTLDEFASALAERRLRFPQRARPETNSIILTASARRAGGSY